MIFKRSFLQGVVETIKQDKEQETNTLVENIEKFGLKDSNIPRGIDKSLDR